MNKKTLGLIVLTVFSVGINFSQTNKTKQKQLLEVYNSKSNPSSFLTSAFPYSFSVSNSTYTDLSGAVSVNNGITWDDPHEKIPLSFNFTLFDSVVTDFIMIHGWFLGGFLSTDTSIQGIHPLLTAYLPDLIDRASDSTNASGMPGSLSPISYKVEGTAGNKILKLEWKNAGFYNEVTLYNTSNDYINMQVWLYEAGNIIEYRYGPSSIANPQLNFDSLPGPIIGLGNFDFFEDTLSGMWLTGNPAAPNPMIGEFSPVSTLNANPSNGTVYRFTQQTTSNNSLAEIVNHIQLYPNPVKNQLSFIGIKDMGTIPYSITDISGKKVINGLIENNSVDVSGLSKGIYFIEVEAEQKRSIHKFIIE
jgi:hypothetical protein